jgi:hypothetical protein
LEIGGLIHDSVSIIILLEIYLEFFFVFNNKYCELISFITSIVILLPVSPTPIIRRSCPFLLSDNHKWEYFDG